MQGVTWMIRIALPMLVESSLIRATIWLEGSQSLQRRSEIYIRKTTSGTIIEGRGCEQLRLTFALRGIISRASPSRESSRHVGMGKDEVQSWHRGFTARSSWINQSGDGEKVRGFFIVMRGLLCLATPVRGP